MSHFYGNLKGGRGGVSRGGTKNSGIDCHVRGWNLGVKVYGYVDDKGNDCFKVYRTSGSNDHKSSRLITTVKRI